MGVVVIFVSEGMIYQRLICVLTPSSLVFCSYEQVLDIAPGRRKRRSDGADILSWEI